MDKNIIFVTPKTERDEKVKTFRQREEKVKAVKAFEGGAMAEVICRDLGISRSTLYQWPRMLLATRSACESLCEVMKYRVSELSSPVILSVCLVSTLTISLSPFHLSRLRIHDKLLQNSYLRSSMRPSPQSVVTISRSGLKVLNVSTTSSSSDGLLPFTPIT